MGKTTTTKRHPKPESDAIQAHPPVKRVKNPHDPRYCKNHRLFFHLLNRLIIKKSPFSIRPADIYRPAKRCKGTFFYHFRSVEHSFKAEHKELHHEFRQNLLACFGKPPAQCITHQQIFNHLAVFILKHRDFFIATNTLHDSNLLHQILWDLYPYITTDWRKFNPITNQRMYALYVCLLDPIIAEWHKTKLHPRDLEKTTHHLTKSTEFFSRNLSTFCKLATIQTN